MISRFVIAAMMSTALIGTAVAQSSTEPSTSPPSATAPATPSTTNKSDAMPLRSTSTEGEWRSSKMIGLNVYNEGNEKLGAISDLILDKDGRIASVVIGIGGFLGMGEHNIAVNFDQLKWMDEPVKTTTSDARPSGSSGSSGIGTMGATGTGSTVGSASSSAPAKTWHPDHAVLANATKEQLKAMPAFKY